MPSTGILKMSVAETIVEETDAALRKRHSIVSGRSDFWSSSDEDEGVQPHEKAIAAGQPNPPYCVRNVEQHAFGRREINIAEQEMPGIMALRARAKDDKPLKDAKENFVRKPACLRALHVAKGVKGRLQSTTPHFSSVVGAKLYSC
ncbi:jg27390 [Pararge aegeria aegeria]|uniref:Jg27390 protein n=1 Tax=Pararge aegeria aegeria TaxID=348720 RepID=A0A8S4RXD8_9NEOP|nr:jg27390 [Pararge aegeria aegeria]